MISINLPVSMRRISRSRFNAPSRPAAPLTRMLASSRLAATWSWFPAISKLASETRMRTSFIVAWSIFNPPVSVKESAIADFGFSSLCGDTS